MTLGVMDYEHSKSWVAPIAGFLVFAGSMGEPNVRPERLHVIVCGIAFTQRRDSGNFLLWHLAAKDSPNFTNLAREVCTLVLYNDVHGIGYFAGEHRCEFGILLPRIGVAHAVKNADPMNEHLVDVLAFAFTPEIQNRHGTYRVLIQTDSY